MFKEISDLVVNSLKPLNKNVLMMGLPRPIPAKIYDYLVIVYPEIFTVNKNEILKYEEKIINNVRYAYVIVKDKCMKKYIIDDNKNKYGFLEDVFFCEGMKTYLFILSDHWLQEENQELSTPLSYIMGCIVVFLLDGIFINNNIGGSEKQRGINYVIVHSISIIYTNWMMIVFEDINAEKLTEHLKYFIPKKLRDNLKIEDTRLYMSYVRDIDISDLLDNSFIAGDRDIMKNIFRKNRISSESEKSNDTTNRTN